MPSAKRLKEQALAAESARPSPALLPSDDRENENVAAGNLTSALSGFVGLAVSGDDLGGHPSAVGHVHSPRAHSGAYCL